MPVQDNVILYESFSGEGIIDNPRGIFESFKKRQDFYKYIHVWVLKEEYNYTFEFLSYSGYPNVKFIYYGTDEYLKYISISKYLINNCTFPSYWTKKKDQVYLNTWHGITRKKLWFDVKNSEITMGNTIRNFLLSDYILSENDFMDQVFLKGAKLDGIGNEKIISNVWAPRRDNLLSKEEIFKILELHGFNLDPNKKIILYAPTWRGTLSNPKNFDIDKIINTLTIPGYQVLVKMHHVNYDKKQAHIPVSIDTNSLLEICDILVTDYSSIYFDWCVSNKPVIFYTPDYNEYIESQGLYYDFPCLPAKNLQMLSSYINNIDFYWNKVKGNIQKDNLKNNGQSHLKADEIINILLSKEKMIEEKSNKIRLLFYAGDFKPNGVTSSFLSLLDNLDYNMYDVSVILLKKTEPDYLDKIRQINHNARVLCRAGTYSQTLLEHCANEIILQKGIGTLQLKNKMPINLYSREWERCFGFTKFDIVINFTGYSPFYSFFFINSPVKKKIIWQHNVMKKDMLRKVNETYPLLKPLKVVYSTYPYYDKIISVSQQCLEENKKDFPEYSNKMTCCYNTIQKDRIIKLSKENTRFRPNPKTLNFINIARLSPAKNQESLIKAFIKISEKHKNQFTLYLVGTGELEDHLKLIAKGYDNIIFLGYQKNPFNLIKKCDYFIFPSLYEGQGLTAVESKILSVPTIVTNLGNIKGVSDGCQDFSIDGFEEESIYKTLIEVYKQTIKNKGIINCKPLNQDYNKEAIQEFNNIIYDCIDLRNF